MGADLTYAEVNIYHGQNVSFLRKPWGCRPDQPVNFLFNRSDISQPTSGQFCVLLYKLTSPADHTLLPFFYYILKV